MRLDETPVLFICISGFSRADGSATKRGSLPWTKGAVLLDLQFTKIDEEGLQGAWRSRGCGGVTCSRR